MTRTALLLTFVNFVALGAGFLRELAIAYHFGTTAASDAFAVTLLFIEGILLLAASGIGAYMLVPIITRIEKEQPGSEFALMEALLLWVGLLSAALCVAIFVWPSAVVNLLGTQFSSTQHALITSLLRVSMPSLPLLMIGGVMGGVLQAKGDYFSPVLGRALFSLAIALFVMSSSEKFGIVSGAIGMVAGAVLQVTLQATALYWRGWRPRLPALSHAALPQAIRFAMPTLLALLLTNIIMGTSQRYLASGLPEGSLAAVNYAQRVLNIVANLSLSFATVSFTELSINFNATSDRKTVTETAQLSLCRSLETGLFLLVPLTVLCFVFSSDIATLLFQRGQFGPSSVALTAKCLRWFTASIVPGFIAAILLRTYPAFWRPWKAAWISLSWTTATIAGTALLLPRLKIVAVPAGYSLGIIVAAILGFAGLKSIADRSFFRSSLVGILRVGICGLISGGCLLLMHDNYEIKFSAVSIFHVVLPITVFVFVFLFASHVSGDPHASLIWNSPSLLRLRRQIGTQT